MAGLCAALGGRHFTAVLMAVDLDALMTARLVVAIRAQNGHLEAGWGLLYVFWLGRRRRTARATSTLVVPSDDTYYHLSVITRSV
jgi:hypothetical protein